MPVRVLAAGQGGLDHAGTGADGGGGGGGGLVAQQRLSHLGVKSRSMLIDFL